MKKGCSDSESAESTLKWKLQKSRPHTNRAARRGRHFHRHQKNKYKSIKPLDSEYPTTTVNRPQTGGWWSAKGEMCAKIKLPGNFLSLKIWVWNTHREITFRSIANSRDVNRVKFKYQQHSATTTQHGELQTKSIMFFFDCAKSDVSWHFFLLFHFPLSRSLSLARSVARFVVF